MIDICVLDDWEQAAERSADWSRLRTRARIRVHHDHATDPPSVIEAIGAAQVLVVMRERTPITAAIIAACPSLQLIVTTGSRNGSLDLAACAGHGITVCGTGPGTGPVVELAWALILSAVRRIAPATETMANGGWATEPGGELGGHTLGLLGLGRTGARMAAIARAFDMDVAAWSPHLTPERAVEHGARYVSREALCAESDILSIHLVLAEATRGILGRRELELMKPTAWLVNTSRGPLIDEDALLAACRDGRIAGALVDVYAQEPLPAEHPARSTPRLLATPHIGYVTDDNLRAWFTDVVACIEAWLGGRPVRVLSG